MSKIVSPIPPVEVNPLTIPTAASWWRLRLQPDSNGHLYVYRTNATDDEEATWATCEFLDGENTTLDAGLDAPNVWGICIRNFPPSAASWLELLCVGRPTPSTDWEPITRPGDHIHPEDRQGDQQ